MAKLDDIRKKLAVEPSVDLDTAAAKGVMVTEAAEDEQLKFGLGRLSINACPSCGAGNMMELGFRHSGIHVHCSPCGFEFTRKSDPNPKHEALVVAAAIKHATAIVTKKHRAEMRALATQQRKGKWTLEIMPDMVQDAILHFGRHAGRRISEISEDKDGRGYLRWLASPTNMFDEELIDIVKVYIEGH